MIRLVPLRAELLPLIPPSADQPDFMQHLTPETARTLAAAGCGFAMLEGGYAIGAGGVVQIWPGRGQAWLVAGGDATRWHLLRAARHAGPWFDQVQRDPAFRRIECTVEDGFERGMRFAELLGFRREGFMRNYGPNGSHHHLFARVSS